MSELSSNKPIPTKIWVGAKRTINTGNYESVSFDAGVELSVPEGAELSEAYKKAYSMCEKEIIKAAVRSGVLPE